MFHPLFRFVYLFGYILLWLHAWPDQQEVVCYSCILTGIVLADWSKPK